ncbi:MAG: TonB-dependent receptor [Bacteroidales bacterium]|jgi:TonB-linked SusC/RagA family outer membrane protein|nr:TonB-dependent receptor [Bacteroidales bacterium]
MKLGILLSIIFAWNVSASVFSQMVHFESTNQASSIRDVLKVIENQTEYTFFYNDAFLDLNRSVKVSQRNIEVGALLNSIFKDTELTYREQDNKFIVITPKVPAQGLTVSGTVEDEGGTPMPGVNVLIKGTLNGVVTDAGGNYSITVPEDNATLVFSFVGYATQEIAMEGRRSINVALSEDTREIEEVVVIGYGTARKADLTGSTSSLSGDRLKEQANPNLSAQLQGQMAGVQVMRSSGDPSSSGTIRIRGVTTMGTSDPLVIIDGVPGSLDDVTPSEVQDIQVLKDAASSAIYGSRAAAGVILVTTRRARNNEFRMTYNFEYGINTATAMPRYASATDWMTFKNELTYNDGGSSLYGIYSQDQIDSYVSDHAANPDLYPMTDWQSLIIKDRSSHEHHSFTLSGGTEKLLSSLSLDYYSGSSLTPGRKFERINARINNEYRINDWINVKADMNVRFNDRDIPADNPVRWAQYSQPLTAAFWSNGLVAEGRDGENPWAKTYLSGWQKQRRFGFTGKVGIDLTPFKGLTLSAVAAPTMFYYENKKFTTKYNLYRMNGDIYPNTSTTNLTENRDRTNTFTLQMYANWQKMINRHSISAMVGYEDYSNKYENVGAWRDNYTLSSYPYLNLGPADQQYNSGSAGHNAYRSVFGRLMYSWANRYLLQFNIRSDGSSRFAKGYRWGTFPSASVGWVISEEPWTKNNGVFDYLKLRASIGQLGNERIGSEFPYMAAMEFSNAYIPNKTTGIADPNQIAYQMTYAFETITWETTTTYGIGLDAAFFKNRLRFTGDWYYKKTNDMLLVMNFPKYVGYNAPNQNAGVMNTKGWDMDLSWNDRVRDFNYGASFNLSDYRSRMGYLGELMKIDNSNITVEGSYFQEWYLYKSLGVILNEDAMYENGNKIPVIGGERPGSIRSADIDGDGKITGDKDRVRSGNSLPELQFGASFWASYKGFDFNLSLQGIGKWMKMVSTNMVRPLEWGWAQVPEVLVGNHWSPYNTDEENAKMRFPMASWSRQSELYGSYDFWLYNAAYMRVKNATLGYTIPSKITKRFKVNSLRFYVSANDLPAIRLGSGSIKGWDPEQAVDADYITTSVIFGVNVSF